MPLTDTSIRSAKPGPKPFKLFDERGLYLEIAPSGGKWWRLKYRFEGKEKRLSMGVYPDVSLKAARERRDEVRKMLAEGVDPSADRKAKKAVELDLKNSFEVVAREWFEKFRLMWVERHRDRILRDFERDVFPWIGTRQIDALDAQELLATIRRIEDRGSVETAHRILCNCGRVMRYAISTGRAKYNLAVDLRGALAPVLNKTHFAAATEPSKVAEILRSLDGYEGTLTVRCALRLAPLVFVRPGELRNAEWAHFDLEGAEWRYTVTKTKTPHIVPLSKQAVAILRELHPLTGRGRYVFPSPRTNSRPMSDNAILSAMRRMGIPKEEMSGHGFRAMARTILDEVLGVRPDFIEHQLAHAVRDPNGRAYNRTAHLPERRKMMQQWADYLDTLKAGAEIVTIHQDSLA